MYSKYSVAATVCSVVFAILASLAVGLRLHARRIKSLSYGADDYIILLALALAISLCCIVLHGALRAGIGEDFSEMTLRQLSASFKHQYFMAITAYLSLGAIKISVLLMYKRIFAIQRFFLIANITMGFVLAWTVASVFTHMFSAWPVHRWWQANQDLNINYGAFTAAMAFLDIALDLVILCLPVPVLRRLNLDTRRKLIVMGMFWLGTFCVVAATVRFYFSAKLTTISGAKRTTQTDSDYLSYLASNNDIWIEIEPCCSIVAACLPTFGPLTEKRSLRSFFQRLSQSSPLKGPGSLNPSKNETSQLQQMSGPGGSSWRQIPETGNGALCTCDVELARLDPVLDKNHVRVDRTFGSEVERIGSAGS